MAEKRTQCRPQHQLPQENGLFSRHTDRTRAVYLHACLRYVNREYLTNASVRGRFGIEPQNLATASRLIREAVEAGLIVPHDPDAAPKLMRYVPIWADPERWAAT